MKKQLDQIHSNCCLKTDSKRGATRDYYHTDNISSNQTNHMAQKSQKLVLLAQQLHRYDSVQSQTTQQDGIPGKKLNSVSQEFDPTASDFAIKGRAAVLICIFEGDDGDFRVFLTKRSSSLSSHSGDVALPGGKRDEGDADDTETALREAKEEIGLDPSFVEVVAVLEPLLTKMGILVVPVVCILFDKKAFTPVLNPDEVESIFDVPLEMFLKDENRRAEEREWMGNSYLLHFFDYDTHNKRYVIWALTAGIMIKVASLVYQRSPAFLERRPAFWNLFVDSSCPKL